MNYFKHPELSEKYHVSLKTIHNWIDAAKQGKVILKLHQANSRTYIANTPENTLVLKQLADKGKKYRNTLHHKLIEPTAEFYEIYNRRQILDIITNLDVHNEIPRQYNYMKKGAEYWDNMQKHLENIPSSLTSTMELIKANMDMLDRLLNGAKRVNVIDIGVGNAYPVKDIVGYLHSKGILHRYIGIDISPTMLSIAERNLKGWYGNTFPFEGYIRDIGYERFDDLLVNDMLDNDADKTVNLVLLLGGTAANFRSFDVPFKIAHDSMSSSDLLMFSAKPDTETSRQYFDFHSTPASDEHLPVHHRYILQLLNIDESLYDVEIGFDKKQKMRYVRIRLRASVTIKFNFGEEERQVNLEKGKDILLLRAWHLSTLEVISELEKTGFALLQASLTKDRQYFLSISGVEVKKTSGS